MKTHDKKKMAMASKMYNQTGTKPNWKMGYKQTGKGKGKDPQGGNVNKGKPFKS